MLFLCLVLCYSDSVVLTHNNNYCFDCLFNIPSQMSWLPDQLLVRSQCLDLLSASRSPMSHECLALIPRVVFSITIFPFRSESGLQSNCAKGVIATSVG